MIARSACVANSLVWRRLSAFAAFFVFLAAGPGSAGGADWPMVNHDPLGLNNQTAEKIITPENVGKLAPRWTITAAGATITPAVVDGAVYFPDSGGKLWKVDAKTGQVIWSASISDYNGIPRSFSRTTPAYADGMIFIGDASPPVTDSSAQAASTSSGAHMMGIDADTGKLRWIAQIDAQRPAILTSSPIVVGDRLYMGVSSSEETMATRPGYPCCVFRGSMVALDIHSGHIVWKTYTMPENGGKQGGFSGGAALSIPAVDRDKGMLYFTSDHQYLQPYSVTACLTASPDDWNAACYPPDARFNSLIAVDLNTGQVRWSFMGAGADVWQMACGTLARSWMPMTQLKGPGVKACPPAGDFLDWSFGTGAPQLFKIAGNGGARDVVGIGEKSGIYWLLDAATGEMIWHTLVGPSAIGAGDTPGGINWGGAYDGQRIYITLANPPHIPYILESGAAVTGGFWVALDPATGKILWQTPDPQGAVDYGAPVAADGVLYVSSLASTGDQMYALDPASGKILWHFAAGGSVGSHPAVADGIVFWSSGFSPVFGNIQGVRQNNKFFAFSVDGK